MCTDPYGVQKFISVSDDIDACETFEVGFTMCLHRLWLAPSGRCLRIHRSCGIEMVAPDIFEEAGAASM
eukprot:3659063-Amphidinium_carterae.5